MVPGDILSIAQDNGTDSVNNVISTGGYNYLMAQQVCVQSVSGNTVNITAPLVYDFSRLAKLSILGLPGQRGIGIENLRLNGSNEVTHVLGSAQNLLNVALASDSWVTNCEFLMVNNYDISLANSVGVDICHCNIHSAPSSGGNHGGILFNSSSCFVYDNIFADGLQPVIECNGGAGNAFFANFYTNNVLGLNVHNSHPFMNLWEENVGDSVILDGYFGSTSHHTFFRNNFNGSYEAMAIRRFTTFVNIVGNVLGRSGAIYSYYINEDPTTDSGIYSMGKPNIGNPGYTGTNPPIPWNFPGTNITFFDGITIWPNGQFIITNAPTYATNRLDLSMGLGTLTNLPNPLAGGYPVLFQDTTAANTNQYYPRDGIFLTVASGRASAWNGTYVQFNRSITFSNGWRVFVAGQNQYQQLQQANRFTDLITGNFDYFHNSIVWDTNGVQAISVSLLYTNGAPSWWGANRWPAIDPTNAPMVTMIPAQQRYLTVSTNVALSFQANPALVPTDGGVSMLVWSAVNATNVTITGIGSVDPKAGSTNVTITQPTAYTAIARGASGSVTNSFIVRVKLPPPSNLRILSQ
jgi:hypothetical protein